MKFVIVVLLLIIDFSFCEAQDKLLPIDEQGKFIYYELVEANGIVKEQLNERVIIFLKKSSGDLKLKAIEGDTSFIAAGKLLINKTLFVMSHPSGEVSYRFHTEVKDGKFRFWLTNFNFIPYQRDRYGNFVASSSKGIPLEADPSNLNAAQWKEYQVQTTKYAQDLAIKFKNAMANQLTVTAPVSEKRIVSKNW